MMTGEVGETHRCRPVRRNFQVESGGRLGPEFFGNCRFVEECPGAVIGRERLLIPQSIWRNWRPWRREIDTIAKEFREDILIHS